MQVLDRLDFRRAFVGRSAVAIGNFDGLHLGHQKILTFLVEKARAEKFRPVVLTFSPHPEKVLGRGRISMIQTLGQRLQGIRNSGVQAVLVASFNRTFAGLSVGAFVENILVSTLDARIVVVGEDFRFGRNRRGGVENLRSWGKRCGFKVHSIPAVVKSGRAVSSSLIRRLLLSGRVDRAQVYLGRPYEIVGRVVRGAARGRSLGFPTANLRTDNEILPEGVFVTIAAINGEEYPAVTNIGFRPTFGCDSLHIETFLLDRREILYRRTVRLRFLKKLRPERTFSTAGALVEQIQMDIAAARGFFQASGH